MLNYEYGSKWCLSKQEISISQTIILTPTGSSTGALFLRLSAMLHSNCIYCRWTASIHLPHPPCIDEVRLLLMSPRVLVRWSLLVAISAHGTACVGGAFSWSAPSRLDACGSLGELLLTLQLEAVWVASAVRIHNAADTVANWLLSTFRVVPETWPGSVSVCFGPDITDFASSTVIIWWAGVVAASPSCNGIKI